MKDTPLTDAFEAKMRLKYYGHALGKTFEETLEFAASVERELGTAQARADSKHGSWMAELKRVGELETAVVQSQIDLMAERTAKEAANRDRSALLAALKGLAETESEYKAAVKEAAEVGHVTKRAEKAAEALDAAWAAARQTAAAAEPKAEGKG